MVNKADLLISRLSLTLIALTLLGLGGCFGLCFGFGTATHARSIRGRAG